MLKLIPSDLRSLSAALPAGPVLSSPGLPGEDAQEAFGFLCIVNAERDIPMTVDGLGFCYICE